MADEKALSIDPKFIIKQHGKDFVLLGGLLDLAHRTGLRQIQTEVLETLCNPEKQEWVVQATVRFRADGEDNVWSAVGDACPGSSQMRGAYLRHAETRAIARALRWATNVAMCSLEELGDEDDQPRHNGARTAQDGPQQRAKHDPQDQATKTACAVCGAAVPAAVANAGLKEFSEPLCIPHAKERRARRLAVAGQEPS